MCRAKSAVKAAITKRSAKDLAELIRSSETDIVHSNTSWTYVGALAAAKARVPFSWHIRELLEGIRVEFIVMELLKGVHLFNTDPSGPKGKDKGKYMLRWF